MSLSSYYRQYDKQNLAELERQKEALRQMSETQKQLVNENADASIKQIEETGNANIREAEHAYDGVINTANVQKLINERQVAERMANLGMTDSGLNRTQQTAVQLSHSNSINNAMVARQKQIDALALAINQQIGQVNIQRKNDLTNLDLTHQQDLFNLDQTYRSNRDTWAADAYDADQARAAAEYKAKLEHDENLIKLGLEADEKAAKDREALIKILGDDDISDKVKRAYYDNYSLKYGDNDEIINTLFPGPQNEKRKQQIARDALLVASGSLDNYIKSLGTPGRHLNKYDKQSIANQINDWLKAKAIDEYSAEYLLREYNIPEDIFG